MTYQPRTKVYELLYVNGYKLGINGIIIYIIG